MDYDATKGGDDLGSHTVTNIVEWNYCRIV